MNSYIPYLHEFDDEVSQSFLTNSFPLEVNCKLVKALAKSGGECTDVNERAIDLDCVEIWLILNSR